MWWYRNYQYDHDTAVQKSIFEMSKGNNKRILDYFANRLDIGNVKFGKEMPADGTYDVEDALEEAIDMVAYLIVCLFHLKDKMDDVWTVQFQPVSLSEQ